MLNTPEAILHEYESRPRALSTEFVRNISWSEVSRFPLSTRFIPVLTYMRNVEKLTEIYFRELAYSSTGKDPVVRRFMARWNEEEAQHGDLIERFLREAGYPSGADWFSVVKRQIPKSYFWEGRVYGLLSRCLAQPFSAIHMTWGAINELSTLQAYRRLIELADHPVLTALLKGIMQEESTHIYFYFNLARFKLERSGFSRSLARRVVERFWRPVGYGIRPNHESDLVMGALFSGETGMAAVSKHVNDKISQLPGFLGFNAVTQRISERLPAALASQENPAQGIDWACTMRS